MEDLRDSKSALRSQMRVVRASITQDRRAQAAIQIADLAASLPGLAGASGVLAYHATAEEIDPAILLERLSGEGIRIAMPRIAAPGRLELHWVDEVSELAPGAYGILEPSPHAPLAEASDIQAALVPGIAFDPKGGRLGFGGGYYDRLIPSLSADTLVIGLAFDEQIIETVPCSPHDVDVRLVVTPTRVFEADC